MRRHVPFVLLSILLAASWACRFRPPAKDTSDSGPSDSQPPDTSAPDDTVAETGDTDHSVDTSTPAGSFVLAATDASTWAADGYTLFDYALGEQAEQPYASLFSGERPSFRLLLPTDIAEGESLALMVWFHEGALGDDTTSTPEGCRQEDVEGYVRAASETAALPTALARHRRWAVAIPRDDWCDGWLGRGPEDPFDPEHHLGSYHVGRVIEFLDSGAAGFSPGERYAWGVSTGGAGALVNAVRHEGFSAVVVDSAPSSPLLAWSLDPAGARTAALEHVLGGPPTDEHGAHTVAWDSWVAASAEELVDNGRLRLPLFELWNSHDQDCPAAEVQALLNAMDAHYTTGPRHGSLDVAHDAPGERFHVQGVDASLPGAYLGVALGDFLEGFALGWSEAEAGCGGAVASLCTLGASLTSDDDPALEAWSAAGARRATAADGIGTAWCTRLPATFTDGEVVEATFVLEAEDCTATLPNDALATVSYREGAAPLAEATLRFQSFLPEDSTDTDGLFMQIAATSLPFTIVEAGSGVLCLTVHARATLTLDGVLYGIEGR